MSEHELTVDTLDPRLDGYRVAHLSDVHCGRLTPGEHVRKAVRLANESQPDLIVMTGDYVCWGRREIPVMEEQLRGLEAARVVVTLGNHDYYTSHRHIAESMRRNGYEVLRNQNTRIERDGAALHLVGVDDAVTRRHDIDRSFEGVPDDGNARLVLSHCPEPADQLMDRGADLVLSGHTHGGQIYIRGITDRLIRRMGRRYRAGFYGVGDRYLYVTTGVGYSGVRVRRGPGTRAEVAVFTLRARARAAA